MLCILPCTILFGICMTITSKLPMKVTFQDDATGFRMLHPQPQQNEPLGQRGYPTLRITELDGVPTVNQGVSRATDSEVKGG